jgi:hypothetical protein
MITCQLATVNAELFFANGTSSIQLVAMAGAADPQWFDFQEIVLEFGGDVQLSWNPMSTNVSYAYAFEPEQVFQYNNAYY